MEKNSEQVDSYKEDFLYRMGHSARMAAKEEKYAEVRQWMQSRTLTGQIKLFGKKLVSGMFLRGRG